MSTLCSCRCPRWNDGKPSRRRDVVSLVLDNVVESCVLGAQSCRHPAPAAAAVRALGRCKLRLGSRSLGVWCKAQTATCRPPRVLLPPPNTSGTRRSALSVQQVQKEQAEIGSESWSYDGSKRDENVESYLDDSSGELRRGDAFRVAFIFVYLSGKYFVEKSCKTGNCMCVALKTTRAGSGSQAFRSARELTVPPASPDMVHGGYGDG